MTISRSDIAYIFLATDGCEQFRIYLPLFLALKWRKRRAYIRSTINSHQGLYWVGGVNWNPLVWYKNVSTGDWIIHTDDTDTAEVLSATIVGCGILAVCTTIVARAIIVILFLNGRYFACETSSSSRSAMSSTIINSFTHVQDSHIRCGWNDVYIAGPDMISPMLLINLSAMSSIAT